MIKKKNKPVTIILLIAVVAIYGSIVYKSFSGAQQVKEQINQPGVFGEMMSVNYQKDSFKIDFYLKDPFGLEAPQIDNQYSMSGLSQKQTIIPVNFAPEVVQPKSWPKVKYYGFVKNETKKKGLYLVSVNDKLAKMIIGQSVQGVTLTRCNADSAVFSFEGMLKVLGK